MKLNCKNGLQKSQEQLLELEDKDQKIGQYGMRALNYLKEDYPHRYRILRDKEKLIEIMKKVDIEAHKRVEELQEQMLKTNPTPNPQDACERFKHKEMIRKLAEEITLYEIVYRVR